MPYTPPASRSPASSTPSSPDVSRRPSFHLPTTGSRPALPRSSAYLTKQRRTPAADHHVAPTDKSSIKQSPPPVVNDQRMPPGAIISPPESSSDDDDMPEMRGRPVDNLREVHDVVSQTATQTQDSPTEPTSATAPGDLITTTAQAHAHSHAHATADRIHHSFSTSTLDDINNARRYTHRRSYTETHLIVPKSAEESVTTSETESDDEGFKKPPMLRKKSGELVRPALRPPSRRRPSSMPGTPTFSKAVHFDSHLEHVRHFLQVDRPLAVSAGSSPVDNYDSDSEYPFPSEEAHVSRSPPHEWDIIINNYPIDTPARKAMPVRLEKVWLSPDRKNLMGSIAILNLAFQKNVTCRFTLDYWKTTSEVAAEFSSEILPRVSEAGHDRFNFSIKLSDLANLESKTLFFALRYNVAGQEFWDNNNGTNFQVDFKKKMLPQNGKKVIGAVNRPAGSLPRSNRRVATGAPRPKSMPVAFNEFGDHPRVNLDQSIHEYLGESKTSSLRLKTNNLTSVPSDNLSSRLSAPSGQAFANRYDFGASLSAAMQAAKDNLPKPELSLRINRKATPVAPVMGKKQVQIRPSEQIDQPSTAANAPVPIKVAPAAIASSSYEELVNKYCFFGSKKSSPQLQDGTLTLQGDDKEEVIVLQSNDSANTSLTASPLVMSQVQRQVKPPRENNNSYFHAAASLMPSSAGLAGSAARSPIGHPSQKIASPLMDAKPRSSPPTATYLPLTTSATTDFAYVNHEQFGLTTPGAQAATIRG